MSTVPSDPTPTSSSATAAPRKVLIGLIGAGIQQSLSPALHEEEARHHGLRLHYQLIDLDRSASSPAELPTLLAAARIMGYAGNANLVLIGFKLTHEPDAGAQARAARELLKRSRARYVVQNDVSTLADGEQHLFFVHENGSSRVRRYVGREKLAAALAGLLEEQLPEAAR